MNRRHFLKYSLFAPPAAALAQANSEVSVTFASGYRAELNDFRVFAASLGFSTPPEGTADPLPLAVDWPGSQTARFLVPVRWRDRCWLANFAGFRQLVLSSGGNRGQLHLEVQLSDGSYVECALVDALGIVPFSPVELSFDTATIDGRQRRRMPMRNVSSIQSRGAGLWEVRSAGYNGPGADLIMERSRVGGDSSVWLDGSLSVYNANSRGVIPLRRIRQIEFPRFADQQGVRITLRDRQMVVGDIDNFGSVIGAESSKSLLIADTKRNRIWNLRSIAFSAA